MSPQDLAAIHAAAFTRERPWSAHEFESLIRQRHIRVFGSDDGFALTRTVAGESELLTIAVRPPAQRRGLGRALMLSWLAAADATEAFLEVAADNSAALALYAALGFEETARRAGYYRRAGDKPADAVLMRRTLPLPPELTGKSAEIG